MIPGQKNWKLYFGEETGIQDLVHFIGRKQNLKDRTGLQSDVHKGVGWISAEAQCSSLQLTPSVFIRYSKQDTLVCKINLEPINMAYLRKHSKDSD